MTIHRYRSLGAAQVLALAAALTPGAGCGDGGERHGGGLRGRAAPGAGPGLGEETFALTPPPAFCSAMVTGTGVVDVETDYLPHVVACENGGADYEALKVQAVSARTFLYYKLLNQGYINDGTGDQVYTCGASPGPDHFSAVADTSGQILMYSGEVIAAFYVAGALQSGPACTGGTSDPTSTEQWVTYNWGNSGSSVVQTPLGWVDPANVYNRGCMSQNGSDCLAEEAWAYPDILRFYYGDDIALVSAMGPCTTGVAPACAAAGAVTCGGGEALSNDAPGSTDSVTVYSCVGWTYPGPEYAYAFTAAATEPVTVTLSGLATDLDLFVLDGGGCDSFACVGASDNSMAMDESVTFDAVEGNEYAIVVDGYDGNVSGYTIAFSCTAPPAPSTDSGTVVGPGTDSGPLDPDPSDAGGAAAGDGGIGGGNGLTGACGCRIPGASTGVHPGAGVAATALLLAGLVARWRRRVRPPR